MMTQIQSQSQGIGRPDREPAARPMLARVADATYWMARYVERSQHVARMVVETSNLLTDVGDFSPELRLEHWRGVLRVFGLEFAAGGIEALADSSEQVAGRVLAYMTFDPHNSNSLLSCITRARENARSIRENISAEMWENLNMLYWSLRGEDAAQRLDDSPQEFYRHVLLGAMLFQGLTDQTMAHGQGWLFARLGQWIERVEMACRVIATKVQMLRQVESELEPAERNLHWMSLLRTSSSLEAYRRIHVGDMDPASVVAFLVLERQYPQSIRYCVHHAHEGVQRVRADIEARGVDPAERILGRLKTQLEYAEVDDLFREGLADYLTKIQVATAGAAEALRKTYFLY